MAGVRWWLSRASCVWSPVTVVFVPPFGHLRHEQRMQQELEELQAKLERERQRSEALKKESEEMQRR